MLHFLLKITFTLFVTLLLFIFTNQLTIYCTFATIDNIRVNREKYTK